MDSSESMQFMEKSAEMDPNSFDRRTEDAPKPDAKPNEMPAEEKKEMPRVRNLLRRLPTPLPALEPAAPPAKTPAQLEGADAERSVQPALIRARIEKELRAARGIMASDPDQAEQNLKATAELLKLSPASPPTYATSFSAR